MTQQYYPPQQPQYPPQQPAAYPQYPQAPVQQAPAPQQFFPGVQAPPAQPQVPLANGTLDDYYNQPSAGGGPSISWSVNGMPKPEGTSYAGIVARDVTNGDVQQQTDPKTGAPKFYRDGRPQFVMKVPLKVQPSQEFPEGDAVLFVRGQMRDELVRAMAEAGVSGAPRGGDALTVTLVQRKPSRGGGMPMNVFAISYQSTNGGSGAPSPAPEPQQQQPIPQVQQQIPAQQAAPPVAQQPAQQVQQQAIPQQLPQPPEGLSPEQQELLARLTGQQG